MITTIFVLVLSVSDVTVTIVDKDTAEAVPTAKFSLNGSQFQDAEPDGTVTVKSPPASGTADVIAPDYQDTKKNWPIKTDPVLKKKLIKLALKPKGDVAYTVNRSPCYVFRPVMETRVRSDGQSYTVAHMTIETVVCTGKGIELSLPSTPAPPGYQYGLVRVETWYDADRDMVAHQPYYAIVPASPIAYPIGQPFGVAPCACQ